MLRTVAGQTIVVPVGDAAVSFNGMISLNETGKTLWKALENETDTDGLVAALLAEYDVDEATAKMGVDAFVAKLRENGFINE